MAGLQGPRKKSKEAWAWSKGIAIQLGLGGGSADPAFLRGSGNS